jgi:SAM-dependent methyltransferase
VTSKAKLEVAEFWEASACGESLYLEGNSITDYNAQSAARYQLEPYILKFMEAPRWKGARVLEIGVGLGADHQVLTEAGAKVVGIDLTERAIEHTKRRMGIFGLTSELRVGDAENLDLPNDSFDLVYCYGVIHHSPDTKKAASEIMRVLKPGGVFKVMIYSKYSLVGLMLWTRFGLLTGRPHTGLDEIYARYLESPGTKAYTLRGAAALFPGASGVKTWVELNHADLLSSGAGQRHEGSILAIARAIWPRWFLKRFAKGFGSHLMIEGKKPA